jgi:phospholipid/cholesterol/gamma-HCH transport system substrate-binding protein
MRKRLIGVAIGLPIVASLLSSCAAINADALPQPGNSYSDGYDLVVEFSNVLNLPERAKVVMDGGRVGVVTGVAINSNHVDVTVRLAPDIQVPADSRAILQQATVLGDIYVALQPPTGTGTATPPLRPGAHLPVAQTTSPPQLEDTIANLANFVASGSIQRMQNAIINVNRVTPAAPEVRDIASRISVDLADLSNNIDVVDQLLNGLAGTAQVVANRSSALSFWFSDAGVKGFQRTTIVAPYLSRVLPSIGSIYSGGYWLVPMLTAVANAGESIRSSKLAVEDEVPAWRRLFTDYFLPQDKYPAVNITSIVGPDGRDLTGDTEQVLRMLGAVP